jgi:hypothetical protein
VSHTVLSIEEEVSPYRSQLLASFLDSFLRSPTVDDTKRRDLGCSATIHKLCVDPSVLSGSSPPFSCVTTTNYD